MKFKDAYDRFINQDIRFLDIGRKEYVGNIIGAMDELRNQGYGMFFIDNLGFVI